MATKGSEEKSPLTILWRIENIRLVLDEVGFVGVMTPILRPHTFGGQKFYLKFDIRSVNNSNNVSLGLTRSGESFDFAIDCKWSFVNCNGSNLASGTMRNQVISQDTFYLPNCPTYEDVFVTRRSEFLHHDTLTVLCHIWKSEASLPNNEFISCRTQLKALEHSFLWPISRFSALELNEEVTTPVTFGDSRLMDNFLMKFSLKGVSLDDSTANMELVSISIFQSYIVTLKLSVLNNHQNVRKYAESMTEQFIEGFDTTIECPDFVSRKEILNKEMDFLRNDVLTLRCEIPIILCTTAVEKSCHDHPNIELDISENLSTQADTICQTIEQNVHFDKISLQENISLASLTEDFLNMYKEENLTDFILCSGEISIPVHKNILRARSPVFKAMFSSNMEESGSDFMDIPDIDSHTLNRMLIFLYSGTLEPSLEMQSAAKLYYAADKYQVQSLKQHCSCILRSCISVSNVSDVLALADKHQDEELTSCAHDFILRHFDAIMQSEEWERFMGRDPALAGSTGLLLYKKKLQLKLA